jgi:hypothetical protein
MIQNKRLLAVKIPKCGANSLSIILKDHDKNWNRVYYYEHDPLFLLDKNNILTDDVFVFCIVRNPYLRFFSQFIECSRLDFKFDNLISFVKEIENEKLHPLITSPQTEYISTEENNNLIMSKEINYYDIRNYGKYKLSHKEKVILHPRLDKIYKLEKIYELEKDFNIIFPNSRFSQYMIKDYKIHFNEYVISFIQDYYSKDFLTFEYSPNFNDSIKYLKKEKKIIYKYN